MKWIVRFGLILVVFVGGAAVLLPRLISTDELVTRAEDEATSMLGRTVDIGDISGVSLFPPRLTISELTISSGEGFEAPYLVDVAEARLAVKLMPLLSSSVEIESFILTEPRIVLENKADGTNNYTFETTAPDTENDGSGGGGSAAPVTGKIEVINGSLLWVAPDGNYGAEETSITLILPPAGKPLTLNTAMKLEGVATKVAVEVSEPWAMTEAKSSALTFDINLGGNTVSGSFDALAEPLTIRGPMSVELSDLAALTPLVGAELVEATAPFGAMKLNGEAEATADRVALSAMAFSSALASGNGELAVDVSKTKPSLMGEIEVGAIDLRTFFPEGTDQPTRSDEPFPEWSTDEIDFSGLDAANANVSLAAEKIILPTYEITNVAAEATLQDGRASLILSDGQAFGGKAAADFILDARQSDPAITANMTFEKIDFAQAAPALLSTDRLVGQGSLGFDVKTSGKSEADWVNALTGKATADIEEGSIAGVSLSTIATTGVQLVDQLRNGGEKLPTIQSALVNLTSDAVSPEASTNFDLADFGLTIDRGVVSIGEAKLLSDTFQATTGGSINLPEQGLDLAIKLFAKAPEQSGYRELRLPVSVKGTFSDPQISLDPSSLAQEAARGAAADALGRAGIDVGEDQSVRGALEERATNELRGRLRGFLGQGQSADDKEDDEEPKQ